MQESVCRLHSNLVQTQVIADEETTKEKHIDVTQTTVPSSYAAQPFIDV